MSSSLEVASIFLPRSDRVVVSPRCSEPRPVAVKERHNTRLNDDEFNASSLNECAEGFLFQPDDFKLRAHA